MILQNPRPAGLSEDMGEGGTSNFMLPTDKTHCFGKTNEPLFLREINNLIFGNQTQISSPSGKNCGRMTSLEPVALGVSMSYPKACLILLVVIPFTAVLAQVSHSEQVQIAPPLIRAIDPPAPDATAADLEQQGDALHSAKLYLDALDYYRAALVKMPSNAPVLNKMCRTELLM